MLPSASYHVTNYIVQRLSTAACTKSNAQRVQAACRRRRYIAFLYIGASHWLREDGQPGNDMVAPSVRLRPITDTNLGQPTVLTSP